MDAINNQLKHIYADPDLATLLLETPLIVGVSGGADSLTLLHVLRSLRGENARDTLHVAHLNHWVRGKEARDDEAFVRRTAKQWGLRCTVGQFDVPNYAKRMHFSTENAARRARYAFFSQLAQENGAAVAVAHNADDQVETVLMGILRGTGVSGLAGMQVLGQVHMPQADKTLREFAPFDAEREVALFRPLLGVWRWQILEYCKEAELEPRWDSTNWERTYRRNRVRHDLIPTIQMQYSLAIKEHIFNLAEIAHGEDALIESMVDTAWTQIAEVKGKAIFFNKRKFADAPVALQRRLARRAILELAGTLENIAFTHIEATRQILAGENNTPSAMHLPHNLQVTQQDARSVLTTRATPIEGVPISSERPLVPAGWQMPFSSTGTYRVESNWRLESTILTPPLPLAGELGGNNLTALFDLDVLEKAGLPLWRTRKPGDFIHPIGMSGRKSLQDAMVDAKIPREQRDHLPLLAAADGSEIMWIPGAGGRRSAHALIIDETRQAVLLSWVFSADKE